MLDPEYGDITVIRNVVRYVPAEKTGLSGRFDFSDELPIGRQNCKEAKPETMAYPGILFGGWGVGVNKFS